ncbi:MAG: YfiR family protein [Vicinamibacterales bacterium]
MRRSRAACTLVFAISLCGAGAPHVQGQTRESEDRLKAAFVSKFPQFVEWPASATSGRTRIDLCVTGPASVRGDLQALVSGETLNGRPILVREVQQPADAGSCHLLYVPQRGGEWPDDLLTAVRSLPVLTVSDRPDFLEQGGIIALRVVQGRIRFEVDVAAAQRVGLRIGSQLLQLALSVRGGGPS